MLVVGVEERKGFDGSDLKAENRITNVRYASQELVYLLQRTQLRRGMKISLLKLEINSACSRSKSTRGRKVGTHVGCKQDARAGRR